MSDLLGRARRGEALTDLGIVDLHGHLGAFRFAIPDPSAAGLVATMDRIGVRTIVCSHTACLAGHVRPGNDEVAAAGRAFPGRIAGYVTLWPADGEQVAAEARRCLDAGFVGIKLHNINGFAYTDPAYAPALAMANARRMPVLLHTWGGEAELAEARDLSAAYPDASIIVAHAGAARPQAYFEIARECPNVYLDPCFSAAPAGMIERLAAEAGADKVVFGSDGLFLSLPQQIGRVLGANIPDAEKTRILAANAAAILGRIRP